MKVPAFIQRFGTPRIREILRYGVGCGLNLLLKTILLYLFLQLLNIKVEWAYFYAHIIILFCGFFYHFFITFQRKFEGLRLLTEAFFKYTAGIIVLKCLDWLLVVNGIKRIEPYLIPDGAAPWLQWLLHFMIIGGSSVILFIVRYLFYHFIFHKKKKAFQEAAK